MSLLNPRHEGLNDEKIGKAAEGSAKSFNPKCRPQESRNGDLAQEVLISDIGGIKVCYM